MEKINEMKDNKIALIICWFGILPQYFPAWVKSCEVNKKFDFLLFTDCMCNIELPSNIKVIPITFSEIKKRIQEAMQQNISLQEPYRICDFRPMFGLIFKQYLNEYNFWGHCDIDIIFGKLDDFINQEILDNVDILFNGGHFSLYRNTLTINTLYEKQGALFDYKKVIKNHAVYAFDETTGIQRISRKNNVRAQFGIPYIETESKYHQLRSRLDRNNPEEQLFYWENGELFRTKKEGNGDFYQKLAYIHLQKRKLTLKIDNIQDVHSFWITPDGFVNKTFIGKPDLKDYDLYNHNDGQKKREEEEQEYKKRKILDILKRKPYQIYVRVRQQAAGINKNDGSREDRRWEKY